MRICLIGGNGLVGSNLTKLLLADPAIHSLQLIIRTELPFTHEKLTQIKLSDFGNIEAVTLKEPADVFISCFGTTIKKAKTQENFHRIDSDYVVHFAKLGKKMGADKFIVVSSLGADAKSQVFFNRVKAGMEKNLQLLNYKNLIILRPSLLLGARAEIRRGEDFTKRLVPFFLPLFFGPFKKYRPIEAAKVALCIHQQIFKKEENKAVTIIESDQISEL